MKFVINQSEFQSALSIVQKGASTRSTLPILAGIYIEARGDSITLQATDLELSIQYTVNAMVEEEGRAVFPAKLTSDVVKNLDNAAVYVVAEEDSAIITCDTTSFSLKTLDPEDFPGFPKVSTEQEIAIPFTVFSQMVKRVEKMVSRDESRPIFTGILVSLEDGALKMVATDTYRLALAETQLQTEAEEFQAVIAGSFMRELANLAPSDEPIRLALAENQIVAHYRNTVFINRRIEGNFPNYRMLIPDSYNTRVRIEQQRLAQAVRRMSLIGRADARVVFNISPEAHTLQLTSVEQDVGSAQEVVSCEGEGEELSISFNCAYVLDGLSALGGESVYLETTTNRQPGIFRAADSNDRFLYFVVPISM